MANQNVSEKQDSEKDPRNESTASVVEGEMTPMVRLVRLLIAVLVVAAIDRRGKAVGRQGPLISGHDNLRAPGRAGFIAGVRGQVDAHRPARFPGQPPALGPVGAGNPLGAPAPPTAWQEHA